jgi:hypothetical protein
LGLYRLLFPSPVRQRKTNRQQFNSKTILPLRTITLLLLLLSATSWSQENLVLNPSFEDTASMTYGYPFVVTSNWWSANGSDADYFSPFEEELPSGSGQVHAVPFDDLGYQVAQDGQAYCGLVIYESTGETKEYVQGFLSSPLIDGEEYCVSIWISLADSSSLRSCDFQVAFSEENVNNGDIVGALDLQSWVDFDISSIDTSSWTLFESSYTAFGGESFIYLGSNTPSVEMTCAEAYSQSWLWNAAYVLLDNVSVKLTENCSVNMTEVSENVFNVFPNPGIDVIHVSGFNRAKTSWAIYNSLGLEVLKGVLNKDNSQIALNQIAEGVYLIIFDTGQMVKWVCKK